MVFVSQQPKWDCTSATDAQCLAVKHNSAGNVGFCALLPQQYQWTQPHISLVSTFNLTCSNSWKIGVSNGVGFAGYLVGSSLFGWLADRW
jgi:OCT family organic cation transporter-like MFS transporter 4/5